MEIAEFKTLRCKPTKNFTNVVDDNGFDRQLIVKTLFNPDYVYDAGRPGQTTVIGNGFRIVGKRENRNFILITVYEYTGINDAPR